MSECLRAQETIGATTGNLAAGGSVVFSLYPTSANCTGPVSYTETKTLAGGNPTEEHPLLAWNLRTNFRQSRLIVTKTVRHPCATSR